MANKIEELTGRTRIEFDKQQALTSFAEKIKEKIKLSYENNVSFYESEYIEVIAIIDKLLEEELKK